MARMNVALIGAGRHGRVLLDKYTGPLSERVGGLYVADSNPAVLKELGERYPDAGLYSGPGELFEKARGLDMVNVSTSSLERGAVHEALERGVPVLVETPLAANISEASELAMKAEERGALAAVAEQEILEPAVVKAGEIVNDYGELGLSMYVEWLKFRGHRTHVITDTMIEDSHPYALVSHLMGKREPLHVSAKGFPMYIHIRPENYDSLDDGARRMVKVDSHPADDGCLVAEIIGEHEAEIEFTDSSGARVNFSYNTPWKSRRIRVISERPWLNPTDTREFYSCTRGFEADVTYLPQNLRQGPGSSLTVWEPDASSEPERTGVMHSHKAEFAQEDLFLQQLSLFMDSVGEGRLSKRLMPFRESLRGLALADMARESIDLGQPIEYRAFADLHGL